eukprot:2466213-Rhodomonas_salina.1
MTIKQQPGNISSLRWCARVTEEFWKPSTEQYELLLAQQPPEEQQRIKKFLKLEDSKRSLMGRLMLQSAAGIGLNMDPATIKFGRTKGKKPFIQEPAAAQRRLNANVSHHGHWVVLGMEEKGLVGVDVSSTTPPRPGMQAEVFFKTMETSLTRKEWAQVRAVGTSDKELYHAFFVFWAFKEAYTKAMGIGLALPFRRLELTVPMEILKAHDMEVSTPRRFPQDRNIKATLDGRVKKDWEFELYALDGEHLMALAIGPHDVAVASWKAAMDELLTLTKAGCRRMSAADIRSCVVGGGNDIPVGNDAPVGLNVSCDHIGMSIPSSIGGAQTSVDNALRMMTAVQLLPQPIAARYEQAA